MYGTVKITMKEIFPANKIQILKNVDVVSVSGKRFVVQWKEKTIQN